MQVSAIRIEETASSHVRRWHDIVDSSVVDDFASSPICNTRGHPLRLPATLRTGKTSLVMDEETVSRLHLASFRAVGSSVRYEGFVAVRDTFRKEIAWDGVVSIFQGQKGRVYAWVVDGDTEPQYIAVPQRPPVDTPWDAVRSWLASRS
jgi:hypothetical protein